jgi:Flp pilus assembly pilin Flp
MKSMYKIKCKFGRFLRDENGAVLAEALITLPLVIWAMVAMFIYWDVFRTINVTQKAAYSVAELLSRQKNPIEEAYADGLQKVVDFLTPGGHPVEVRITSLEYDEPNDEYDLCFSYSPLNKVAALDKDDIQKWKTEEKIPVLRHRDSVFVVETTVAFKSQMKTVLAGFMIGVEDATFGNFIVTRPRHSRLLLEPVATEPCK